MVQAAAGEPLVQAQTGKRPVVVTQGLTKIFRDFWMRPKARAVDSLDMEIHEHEIFGLLGPNGSGKSTTIKILLGLLHKTRGRVAVFGRPPSDVAIKKRIGVLPEESYLYPFLNARETLDYYGKLFQLDYRVRKRRIEELLDMVGLAQVQHRQVKEYSKGMQRRIGLAQALINDPEFLVLDEPTTGLDPLGTRQVKDLIVSLGRRGKTVLLSSHQLSDVEDCVDRLAILYGGKKRAEGTCDELLTAREKMTLEVDAIDDETVSQIDDLLMTRTGHAIRRVTKPRQKLEELFVSIVDQARDEQAETSGAASGGQTAAFLLAEEEEQSSGSALIEELVSEQEAPAVKPMPVAGEPEPVAVDDAGPDSNLIEGLVKPRKEEASAPAPKPDPAKESGKAQDFAQRTQDADLGMISSLLDTPDEDEAKDDSS